MVNLINKGDRNPGDTAFALIYSIEGLGWKDRQTHNRDLKCLADTDFYAVLEKYQSREFYDGCIYGSGGWNRWFVDRTGEITFSGHHSNEKDWKRATELGFKCTPLPDFAKMAEDKRRTDVQRRSALTELAKAVVKDVLIHAKVSPEDQLWKELTTRPELLAHVGVRITGWVAQQCCVATQDHMASEATQIVNRARQDKVVSFP